MSPRRMDISSLLRDPSPPTDEHHRHHHPASLLAILNNTDPPPHRSPPRPPFLGLDALVHVASEEHRRISAVSASLSPDRDTLPHDHDRPSRRYSYPPPLPRLPDSPSLFQDNVRPHKRPCPPSPPRSPSPGPGFNLVPIQSMSPSVRHHPSASPTNNYPSPRLQPVFHRDSARSPPAFLVGQVNSPVSLYHTSPFSHSSLPPRSSPRNSSPHRLSPQHTRSQHHSSPVLASSLIPEAVVTDVMSPRYGYGPRMAGGVQVLSSDSYSVRDLPKPDFSTYQNPPREERFAPESHVEPPRHEPSKLSPPSVRAFSLDDRYQVKAPFRNIEVQESMSSQERVQSHPLHLPSVDSVTESMETPVKDAGFQSQQPHERHPIRVWEEQSTTRNAPRRVSPARMPDIVSTPTEQPTWSGASGRLPEENRPTALQQDVVENVHTRPFSPYKHQTPSHYPTLESLVGLQTSIGGTHPDLQPLLSIPTQSEPQAHLPQTPLPYSLTPRAPSSPVPDLPKNHETQFEPQPEHSEKQADTNTSVPLMSSDPTATEPVVLDEAGLMPGAPNSSPTASPLPRQPSPEPVRLVTAREPERFGMSAHSTHASISESSSRSPSQQLPVSFPIKDEHNSFPEDAPILPPVWPEPVPRQSSEPGHSSERESQPSEQAMMDVDEELLSLVEDRPVRAVPTIPKTQLDSRSLLPVMGGQVTGIDAEQVPSLLPSSLKNLVTDEEKDRASMPPPAARSKKSEKERPTLGAATSSGSRKKKDATSKPATKPKQPPKTRAKPVPKPKPRPNMVDTSKASILKHTVNANARSRSTSVIPGAVDDAVAEPEVDHSDKEDDKLYCVCKTRYDEDRVMIACDRCDEWFHTVCINMPDLEIDLVDQFICPPCIQKHPHLRTTWKRRCLFGLQHENPSSPEACHRPSRGAFSKYCSDDCGLKHMQARISQWEESGGMRDLLWESVKNAAKREGVVVCVETNGIRPGVDSDNSEHKSLDCAKRRAKREVARLNTRLDEVVKEREFMKRELDMVLWRERVVQLASERAEKADECGWDQRLCFGEEEWADFGSEVLESYEEERVKVESEDDVMVLDATFATQGEWWCTGKKKCERHAGWQKLRTAEVSFDKETKEGALLKLTTHEREIRKRIEDIVYLQPTDTLQAPIHVEVQLNGSEKFI